MLKQRMAAMLVCATVLFCLPGCSSDTPTEVSGSVWLDGSPMKEGDIIFEPVDSTAAPAGAPIKDGKYTAKVPPGQKKVRINSSRPSDKADEVMGVGYELAVQAQFNTNTILQVEIKPGKQDGVDFRVLSPPREKKDK